MSIDASQSGIPLEALKTLDKFEPLTVKENMAFLII